MTHGFPTTSAVPDCASPKVSLWVGSDPHLGFNVYGRNLLRPTWEDFRNSEPGIHASFGYKELLPPHSAFSVSPHRIIGYQAGVGPPDLRGVPLGNSTANKTRRCGHSFFLVNVTPLAVSKHLVGSDSLGCSLASIPTAVRHLMRTLRLTRGTIAEDDETNRDEIQKRRINPPYSDSVRDAAAPPKKKHIQKTPWHRYPRQRPEDRGCFTSRCWHGLRTLQLPWSQLKTVGPWVAVTAPDSHHGFGGHGGGSCRSEPEGVAPGYGVAHGRDRGELRYLLFSPLGWGGSVHREIWLTHRHRVERRTVLGVEEFGSSHWHRDLEEGPALKAL